MNIYRIEHDSSRYAYFALDDMDVLEKMEDFDIRNLGLPLEFSWKAPKGMFLQSDTGSDVRPDITEWATRTLVVRDQACSLIKPLLDGGVAEVYPLAGDSEDYLLVNPVKRLGNDIVDLERTKSRYFDDGTWDEVEELVLRSSEAPSAPSVFTLEYENGAILYCNELFKQVIEKYSLKGLRFFEIQTS